MAGLKEVIKNPVKYEDYFTDGDLENIIDKYFDANPDTTLIDDLIQQLQDKKADILEEQKPSIVAKSA